MQKCPATTLRRLRRYQLLFTSHNMNISHKRHLTVFPKLAFLMSAKLATALFK
jgi:hypothetical protein